jgi:hypothetical protein
MKPEALGQVPVVFSTSFQRFSFLGAILPRLLTAASHNEEGPMPQIWPQLQSGNGSKVF